MHNRGKVGLKRYMKWLIINVLQESEKKTLLPEGENIVF
jgi:hypothetical protein